MKTKHTPGPWVLCAHLREHDQCSCGYRGGIWGADGEKIICEMGSQPTPGQEGLEPPRHPREVEFANARLIASAPDMLAALTKLCDFIDNEGPASKEWEAISEWCEKGRAAIVKATGKVL